MFPAAIAAGAIGAGANLLGGFLGSQRAEEARAQNAMMQTVFAKNGIRWRVADAEAAGIHPLYALGASTSNFAPSSVGDPLGAGIAAAGQDVSRAIMAGQSAEERSSTFAQTMMANQLERGSLQNDLLRLQIRKLDQSLNPPGATASPLNSSGDLVIPRADDPEERPRLTLGNGEIQTDPRVSNAQNFEDRYGELIGDLLGMYVGYKDYQLNTGGLTNHLRSLIGQFVERERANFYNRDYRNSALWRGHY